MNSRLFILLAWSGIFCIGCNGKRSWDYDFISFTVTSSDESKLNVSGKAERRGGSERAITAVADWKFDTDDQTMVELRLFSCQTGREDDFYELPLRIPSLTFNDFIDKHYEELVYKNYGHCSNLEHFEGKFVAPFPKKTYVFNRCLPAGYGFPDISPLGYYKLDFKISGEVELMCSFIIKISPKLI